MRVVDAWKTLLRACAPAPRGAKEGPDLRPRSNSWYIALSRRQSPLVPIARPAAASALRPRCATFWPHRSRVSSQCKHTVFSPHAGLVLGRSLPDSRSRSPAAESSPHRRVSHNRRAYKPRAYVSTTSCSPAVRCAYAIFKRRGRLPLWDTRWPAAARRCRIRPGCS